MMKKGRASTEPSFLDKPLFSVVPANRQTLVLCLVILALLVTRLYDLGNRAYCHDESTHAWESWKLFTGQGYRFDPVFHGPFMYHLTAFVYFLLGVSDATARVAAALFAVATVLLVWPMRRWLGRAGALFAMLLLTVSPTLMFRGRFIRHDIFVIAPSMVMVIAFFRYLEERRERWLYLIAATLSLMVCVKAVAFIYGAIFGSFWVLYLLWRWVRDREPLRNLPVFDLVILLATLALPMASALVLKVVGFNPLDYSPSGLWRIRIVVLLLLVMAAAIGMWWKRKAWLTAAAIFYTIFIPLYTTMFTNVRGLEAGFVGMLGYWTSQQSVARGGQPWYYYFFLLGVYEFLPLLLSGLSIVYYLSVIVRRGTISVTSQRRRRRGEQAAGIFVPFLVYWMLMDFAIFAWSGEKMPWLTQHLVMPLGLLSGWFLGQVWERTDWRKLRQQGALSVAVLLPLGLFLLFVLLSTMRAPIRPFSGTGLEQMQATLRWVLALILLLVVAGLIDTLGRQLSRGAWARIVLGIVCVVLMAVTVRFALMLSFVNQDYATEFLVYAASTPDTAAIMRELDEMSRRMIGSEVLRIAYDNESQQPFFWYLRDREGVSFFTGDTGLPGDPHVVIIGLGNESKLKSQLVGKYVRRGRDYRLIWWPDEEPYRNLTLARLWKDLWDPARRRYWWDILWFRKYPHAPTSWPLVSKFALYVRKDLAAQLWDYGPEVAGAGLELPEDEYEKKRVQVTAVLTWGGFGTGAGQFSDPKGIAVDGQGNVYVVDTRNHRVQVFDGEGRYLRGWGRQGNGSGEFQEPWGIAVDKEGNVYVADTWNHRIQKFDREGRFIKAWGVFGDTGGVLGAAEVFYGPRDVEVDSEGNLLVSDTGNKRVLKFTVEGEFLGQWGGGGSLSGQMKEPCGIAVDRDGNIYIADVWNERVQKFDRGWNYVTQWMVVGWESELPVNKPYVAVDGRGDVYVTVPEYHRVVKFDGNGKVLAMWGVFGSDAGSFNVPSGIAVDGEGYIYVADSGNHRIMKFAPIN